MNWILKIQECFDNNLVFYTKHSRYEMKNEKFSRIYEHEIYEAIYSGKIIEEYPKDKPYPSALIFGKTKENRPLHIVCAYDKDENLVIIITVYHPDTNLWIEHERRKKL